MKDKVEVVITSGYRWNYFQWFLLGFYELQNKNIINLKFRLPFFSYLLTKISWDFLINFIKKFQRKFENDSYNMDGYIIYKENGRTIKKTFTIDSADSPFLFDQNKLDEVDTYFKMQCPIELNKSGFRLADNIVIPWSDHRHVDENLKLTERGERRIITELKKFKIEPLMIGPRQLASGISYRSLRSGYENYINDRSINKSKHIMCYYGNALGPQVEKAPIPDYDWEGDIMGYYKDASHPNEKRAVVTETVSKMENCDARIISRKNADSSILENKNLIIPLKKFCKHISEFEWNVNVSGYRMSIPNRFIESFMVGTGIITDKLFVKWYKPFDEEIFETVEMGYLPMEKVNWKAFKSDLNSLPKFDSQKVIKAFEKKWSPCQVAKYIITTVKGV